MTADQYLHHLGVYMRLTYSPRLAGGNSPPGKPGAIYFLLETAYSSAILMGRLRR
jgi:hypothetical protein